jgi:threonine aldolase
MAIDLRSDTVTRPTLAMRDAMARAEVGDDVYGEDPTVKRLEERVAALLDKPAALFVSSGTMGNQLALLVHASRGDEVYAGEGAHCAWYESGAAAALAGVQIVEVGRGGVFDTHELEAAIKPRAYYGPNPRLVVVENTHNRGGGRVFPLDALERVATAAWRAELGLHLDGARLWNAAAATGLSMARLARPFDSATVCFSKGLGAPAGSVLVGDAAFIQRAHRFRKMLGGGMRQVGVLAAAALHALDHHVERLALDHAAARALAARLADSDLARRERLRVTEPETNIVMIDLDVAAEPVVRELASRGVRMSAFGPRRLRAVTHLDVSLVDCERAADVLLETLDVTAPEMA